MALYVHKNDVLNEEAERRRLLRVQERALAEKRSRSVASFVVSLVRKES